MFKGIFDLPAARSLAETMRRGVALTEVTGPKAVAVSLIDMPEGEVPGVMGEIRAEYPGADVVIEAIIETQEAGE